ncbi:hypothetical protein ACGC1H_005017 [Rhizoctonia solani]
MAHRIVRTYIAIEQQDHGTTLRHSSLLPNHHVATWWQIRSILWQSRLHAQNLHYPTPIMKSGTYRIVNLSNEKAIADDDNKIVFSRKEDSKDQQVLVISPSKQIQLSHHDRLLDSGSFNAQAMGTDSKT